MICTCASETVRILHSFMFFNKHQSDNYVIIVLYKAIQINWTQNKTNMTRKPTIANRSPVSGCSPFCWYANLKCAVLGMILLNCIVILILILGSKLYHDTDTWYIDQNVSWYWYFLKVSWFLILCWYFWKNLSKPQSWCYGYMLSKTQEYKQSNKATSHTVCINK